MTIRRYWEGDKDALKRLSDQNPYFYPEPDAPLIETVWVAEDESGRLVMAISAQRAAHLFAYFDPGLDPGTALAAGRELLQNISADLCLNNYNEADAFVSPQIEKSFGRHLTRHFKAIRNWASYCFKF